MLSADIDKQLLHHRLTILLDQLPSKHLSLPLGLVPEDDGGFRRIHDLSYPRGYSTNDHELGSVEYITFGDDINAVRRIGRGTALIKKNLQDAVRHIPSRILLRMQFDKIANAYPQVQGLVFPL